MAKDKSQYTCQQCGASQPRWAGQCGSCGAWNSLVEEMVERVDRGAASRAKKISPLSAARVGSDMVSVTRESSGLSELDRVLGSSEHDRGTGMVAGSVLLIGGEPGIGKSTLLTQVALYAIGALRGDGESGGSSPNRQQRSVLYVCGEESPSQIYLRIKRIIDIEQKKHQSKKAAKSEVSSDAALEQLDFLPSTDVDRIIATIHDNRPDLVIIDSIQTMKTADLTGAAGSVGQVRESAERLTQMAKALNVTTWIVGHVTKEGQLAGPKVLEHIVDAVLELSGERGGEMRLLRAAKNRFGATDEVGVFQLTEFGFESVANPSQLFLEHEENPVPGSATVCIMEGTRPLLLEVQALAVASQLAMPRRVGRGVEQQRLHIITAVLQKYSRIPLDHYDIYVSLAGGFKSAEPSLDLGIAIAIASSFASKSLPKRAVCIGEVGLLGELRHVSYFERRVKEASRLGYDAIIAKSTHATIRDVLKAYGMLRSK